MPRASHAPTREAAPRVHTESWVANAGKTLLAVAVAFELLWMATHGGHDFIFNPTPAGSH